MPLPQSLIVVDDEDLRPLISRPKLYGYIHELWQRRYFIFEDAKGKSFSSDRDMILGRAWKLINPFLDAAMYGIIFGLLLNTSKGIDNYIGYLIVGLIFFSFLTSAVNGAAGLIQSSRNLINSFSFPRASLVFALITRQYLDNIIPACVALAFALFFQLEEGVPWTIILVPVIYTLMHIFSCGLAFFIARITAFIPDFRALLKIFVRAWFYSSGVFFAVESLAPSKKIQAILELNPGYQFLKALRNVALYGNLPSVKAMGYLVVVSVIIFVFGLLFFWRAEARYVAAR